MAAQTPVFRIVETGPYSSFQDKGRKRCQHLGFTTSGAMDQSSMRLANRLCNNADNSCVIEVTLGGLVLDVLADVQVAITGGSAMIRINGCRQNAWALLDVKKGDRIALGYCRTGFRCYLAIVGGFRTEGLFGSQSVVKAECVSGLYGTVMEKGGLIYAIQCHRIKAKALPYQQRPRFEKILIIHVITGLQVQGFSSASQQAFFSSPYRVTPDSDRMAYRFSGEALEYEAAAPCSEPVFPGVIQVPPDGQPIIMMREHQTLGGYPKLGVVAQMDMDRLAQLPPGGRVYFHGIDVEKACVQWKRQRQIENNKGFIELLG